MSDQPTKVLRGGKLIDGTGRVVEKSVLVIKDKRLAAVGSVDEVTVPADAEVIDTSGFTVMPGMIDCHLHITELNAMTFDNYRASRFETSTESLNFYGLFHAQICMEMGFTTLRDVGALSPRGANVRGLVALRDAIRSGIVVGPRLQVSGFTHMTGSHFDLVLPRAYERPDGWTADGPWELRKMARSHLRTGVDWIKTNLSGGGGTDAEEPDIRNMTQEEMDALTEEAHNVGKRCACHCFTAISQKMAMKAGVDTLEHCVWTDDEAIQMMLATDTPLVPTLAHRTDRAIEVRRSTYTPQFVLDKLKRIQPQCMETFKRLHQSGVKIVMGTDTQLDPMMGNNALELEVYVDCGMSPMEAIQTTTKNAAEALHLSDRIGTVEAGKLADLLVVKGDPLHDITVLQKHTNIQLVMKEGEAYVDRRIGRKVILDRTWQNKLDSVLNYGS